MNYAMSSKHRGGGMPLEGRSAPTKGQEGRAQQIKRQETVHPR